MNPPSANPEGAPEAASEPQRSPLRQGFLVADKYGLIEPLGTGSMGTVWKATHVMLGHTVAIKFLHAPVEAFPEGRTRFEREAKLSARLGEASRHICKVTDFGVIGNGTPFVVMELLQGEELSVCLRREQQLPLTLVVEIVTQLCRALQVAHAAGVIHRDLKPANIFLCKTDDGQGILVKLLDFGVAKAAVEHEDTQATRAGTVFGTPGYMSPEQIVADSELDPRSDLWSLAVVAYRMITGKTPFGGGALSELGLRILSTHPPAPSTIRPDLPAGIDSWMRKALAKRRDDRFASAGELAEALLIATGSDNVDFGAEDELTLVEQNAGVEDPATYKGVYRSDFAPPPVPVRGGHRTRTLVAASLLAGGIVFFLTRRPDRRTQTTPPAPAPTAIAKVVEAPVEPETRGASPDRQALPSATEASAVAPADAAPSATPQVAKKLQPKVMRTPAPSNSGAVVKRAGELWNKKDEL